ncbi:MAG: VWA domain-containing protein [Thermodesulfobacteriota bacterium]|nr:VWA domain-containing protein [Thermodesulfobacteriota bacterium]
MFRFADPWFLTLLLVVPVIVVYTGRWRTKPVMDLSTTGFAAGIARSFWSRTRWLPAVLGYAALILLIAALARPQWGTRKVETLTRGVNIVLAVDVSKSMAAIDFEAKGEVVNRLEAVKSVVSDFIANRTGDRIGMVVFGTHAFTQVPLTRDYDTIAYVLERLEIGAAGDSTAIGDAIGIALKRLQDIDSKSNVMILLTDGESNAGELSPDEATAMAEKRGVKIYTIGVGGDGRAPFLVNHPLFGQQYVYQQVSMDEVTLQRIADRTGGVYFKAENTDALRRVYKTIDRMEKTEVPVEQYTDYRELYPPLVMLALILVILQTAAENTRYLEVP